MAAKEPVDFLGPITNQIYCPPPPDSVFRVNVVGWQLMYVAGYRFNFHF